MKRIRYIVLLLLLAFSFQAWALNLDTAKSQGLVGEKASGYLGAIQTNSEVMELVSNVNKKRQQAYQRIAAKNGTSLQQVEQVAGKKVIEKTVTGNYIQNANGKWVKK